MTDTLLLVDIQNDFLPGGALAVADGDAVVPVANRLMPLFSSVVASQDWHPADHLSFVDQHAGFKPFQVTEVDGLEQILWPAHCVQGSPGASFASALDIARIDYVVRKGENPRIDSYSAFYDNDHRHQTDLTDILRRLGTDRLFVMGLAADVCVKFTVMDALAEGFAVTLIVDGVRGVDMHEGDTEAAIQAMRAAGAECVNSTALVAQG
ncbi:bifunctional nicotinamidase/pyrazinamidase [Salinisphaera hydrothermalis]|uniref:Nicotinamidase n=1 Tax=Salinisphaera hydrothermalis (strain C41B8) TaxID=1304275 RepID=A0A084IID0_SALHC|nr:bifunctional nicotinamidase/pyrazinamidase [Salinisphaera hydrothermalis]KEZ76464.1 nicotinamidase-like amidase [Salinisphaera hydrothermalis C41B8]